MADKRTPKDKSDLALRSASVGSIFWVLKIITFVVSSLSIVMLIRLGFEVGHISAPLLIILQYYERFVDQLFGWADPILQNIISIIGAFIKVDITLYEHWKHVLVVLLLYMAAVFRVKLIQSENILVIEITSYAIGAVIALVASVIVSLRPLDNNSVLFNILFAIVPISAYWVNRPARLLFRGDVLNAFKRFNLAAKRILISLVITTAFVIIVNRYDWLREVAHLGMLALALFIIFEAFRLVFTGWLSAKFAGKGFIDQHTTQIGLAMMGAFFGAAIFFVCNAGLRLIGL
ncbi:hypothetical protein [Marinicauda salina]|uniref:hypothetical protein n=1 Tax=Marinicauda salina TaxID=2135793 RepID=UPI0011B252DD|nr:hypothetical protein [Marinicauda salina]